MPPIWPSNLTAWATAVKRAFVPSGTGLFMLAHYFENHFINTHKLGCIAFVLAMPGFTSLTWADVHDPLDADPYVRYVQGELGRVSVEPMSPAGSVPQSRSEERRVGKEGRARCGKCQ